MGYVGSTSTTIDDGLADFISLDSYIQQKSITLLKLFHGFLQLN